MSFPPYAEYKDSGVAWLGAVPRHWEVAAIKWMVDDNRPITYGIVQAGPDTPNGIPYVRPADMTAENGVADMSTILRTTPEIAAPYQRSVIRTGDLICSIGPSFGKVMVVPNELDGGNLTQGTARIAPKSGIERRFLFWLLRSRESVAQWESSIGGATFRALNLEPLANTLGCLPPFAEQEAIAGFLDREVGKIDRLAAEQERLIALLKEKRQAVISHAVTKGLNPNAPLKDSGIEWLCQIPAHWEVVRIKHVVVTIEQGWSPQCDATPADGPEQWGVLKVGCVNGDRFNASENKALPDDLEPLPELSLRAGDLLISRANTRELVGSAALVEQDHDHLLLCDKLYRLRLQTSVASPEFLTLFLRSSMVRGQIEIAASGASSSMLNIGQSVILEMALPLPPLGEQGEIATWILKCREQIEALINDAQSAITLLQERRAALISAAVTGKIDVRAAAANTTVEMEPA